MLDKEKLSRLHALVWDSNLRNIGNGRRIAIRAARTAIAVVRDLFDGQITLRAMSLVYTTLLSTAPLLALSFSVLKALGAHHQIEPLLMSVMEPLGDKGVEIGHQLIGFVENIKVGVLGSVGLGLLIYTVISLIQKIESAFNFIWHINRPRSFGERFRDYLSVVVIGPVLVVSALGITASTMNSGFVLAIAGAVPYGADLLLLLTKMLPFLMIIAAFTFVYMFIPNTRVHFSAAFGGALVAGVLWQTLGILFAKFAVSSAKYDAIYSGFAIMILLLIWLHLCWLILLAGANISYYLQHPTRTGIARGQFALNNRDKEHLGLAIMLALTRRHIRGSTPWSADELTQMTGITGEAVDYLLELLQRLHLVSALAGEPTRYTLAIDPASLDVSRLMHGLRMGEPSIGLLSGQDSVEEILAGKRLSSVDQLFVERFGGQSLREMAMELDAAETAG